MKKKNLIGACIALVALVLLIFLPIVNVGKTGVALFDLFSNDMSIFAISWIIFPVFCIFTNLIGKIRVISALLMLVPFLWGLCYLILPEGGPGIGVWLYGIITAIEIIFSLFTRKKDK